MTTLKDLEDFVRAMSKDGKSLGDFGPLFESLRWRPIETAPKDGIPFLVYGMKRWDTPAVAVYDFPGFIVRGYDGAFWEINRPTHWKPLDTPPEDT